MTKAGITEIAGHSDITTETQADYAGALNNSFNASTVNQELGAQVESTRAFGQEAPKTVGDSAGNKLVELLRQGKFEEADKWAEDGVYRVALHTLVGALATGSIDGAVASGTTAVSVPALDNYLKEQGLDDTAREAVLLGFSASVGASIGGDTASTVSSYNQTDNNYLDHLQKARELTDCKSVECVAEVTHKWNVIDSKQSKAFNDAYGSCRNYAKCDQFYKIHNLNLKRLIDNKLEIN